MRVDLKKIWTGVSVPSAWPDHFQTNRLRGRQGLGCKERGEPMLKELKEYADA